MVNGVGIGISHGAVGGSVTQGFDDNIHLTFGTGDDSHIYYDDTDTFWDLQAVGTGGLMIALAGSFPSPDSGAVHIWDGSAGNIAGQSGAQLIIESSGDVILNLLSDDDQLGIIAFGDTFDANPGEIRYRHGAFNRFEFRMAAGADNLFYSVGAFAFQEATEISTTAGDLTLNPSGLIDASNNTLRSVNLLTGRATATFRIRANAAIADATAQRLQLETIDTVGNAAVIAAYADPTGTETTPFWAQRADVTTPLVGTLDASFLTFKWDPGDDSVTVFVNDGGVIRSVAIGTVT